uniref:VPS37 C-terminal domain-containing protein n=1 Tax=Aureoumbra lagunensis TaxID=44058 RepID=A0A7S3K345_9STRA|mmetsp:Transcript_15641/g.20673  ORF Transcript_15641/g.20673 Transcript_15641/m.20673 type:complete len:363 (+) Transcript_15641:25-1113(+)
MFNLNIFGRPLATEKDAQIKELQRVVPSTRMASEDGSLIDVNYGTNGSKSMRIFLPQRFPQDRPVLQLMGNCTLSFVDQYNQINVPYLSEWTSRSSLAELVSHVLRLLETEESAGDEKNNDRVITWVDEEKQDIIQEVEEEAPTVNKKKNRVRPISVYETPLPEIPGSFAAIDEMTEEEAEEILDDENKFELFFLNEINAVRSMRELRDSLRASNEKAAIEILVRAEKHESSLETVKKTQSELQDALEEYDNLRKQADQALQPADAASAAIAVHEDIARSADSRSEKLIDDFRDNAINLSTWLKTYKSERLTYHTHSGLASAYRAQKERDIGALRASHVPSIAKQGSIRVGGTGGGRYYHNG